MRGSRPTAVVALAGILAAGAAGTGAADEPNAPPPAEAVEVTVPDESAAISRVGVGPDELRALELRLSERIQQIAGAADARGPASA